MSLEVVGSPSPSLSFEPDSLPGLAQMLLDEIRGADCHRCWPLPQPINISRVFLGWNAPPLPAAAAELVKRYRSADTLDLSRTVVVVPGKRAGRCLRELLVDAAARDGLLLTPPDIVTESTLPERLYSRQK